MLIPIISGLLGFLVILAAVVLLIYGTRVRKWQLCLAKQWTTVIGNFGTGMPRTFQLRLTAQNGGTVSGQYSEKKYLWILPLTPRIGDLKESLVFHRDWLNAIYVLKICPDVDTVVEM
jgi:hypothetical protein